MQDYIDFANKNGVTLFNTGECQFCGAKKKRGVHECIEIFSFQFKGIDFSNSNNHIYKFLIVDSHALQHPEIHGRWSNHFHLLRLHLIIHYQINWNYQLSPKLSDCLSVYKSNNQDDVLQPPVIGNRGNITTQQIIEVSNDASVCKKLIEEWAHNVYNAWSVHHSKIDNIASQFKLKQF